MTSNQSTNSLEEKDSHHSNTATSAGGGGLGRRNSLSQTKIHSNTSINDLPSCASTASSMSQPSLLKHTNRSTSQPRLPGFTYSHNPLNVHFTSHHLDTTEELEILRRQEAAAAATAAAAAMIDPTDYDSKWMETHLHFLKTVIESHITPRLLSNPSRSLMRNTSDTSILSGAVLTMNSTPSGGVKGITGAGGESEKKRSPVCVPIFESTHHSQQHSRGYSIIAPLPGSSSIQSTGSFMSMGESPATGGGGTGAMAGGDQNDLGMGFRNSLNSSQIFLVGVLLDRKGGQPEMKHEMITSQHVDDVGREMSRVVKNITELISGKDLFKTI